MRSVDVSLGQIVESLGGELFGSSALRVSKIAPLGQADAKSITFLSSVKYAHQLGSTGAACVIVHPSQQPAAAARGACIVTTDPYLYYAKLTQWWKVQSKAERHTATPLIHPTAVLGQNVQLGEGVRIDALCVLEDGARIGSHTHLHARVTVGLDCQIGTHCILHSGVVVGADGFGFAPDKATGAWVKIEQLGAVRIGNHVEIGANTCIDRGALGDTVLEDGVKLDNLIQIGHNVHIGKHTALAGCVGVAGSATIGAHCTVGGGAVVLGHLSLADHVHISAASVVTRSITQAGTYTGLFPLDENAAWEKNAASLKQLHRLRERVRRIEQTTTSQTESSSP